MYCLCYRDFSFNLNEFCLKNDIQHFWMKPVMTVKLQCYINERMIRSTSSSKPTWTHAWTNPQPEKEFGTNSRITPLPRRVGFSNGPKTLVDDIPKLTPLFIMSMWKSSCISNHRRSQLDVLTVSQQFYTQTLQVHLHSELWSAM